MFARSGPVAECEREKGSSHHCDLRQHRNTCVPGHTNVLLVSKNLDDLEVNEFADVLGEIAEDFHLTQCAQVRSTGTEDDQTEQHDHGTIDEEVLGNPDMERGGDAPEEADREADPPEQIPQLGDPESRPCTFNREVGIDAFEIIDPVSKLALT